MMFQTYGNRNHPAVLFFSCYGCDGGEQRTGCKLFTGSVFLHFTYLHRVLQRAEICQQGGQRFVCGFFDRC